MLKIVGYLIIIAVIFIFKKIPRAKDLNKYELLDDEPARLFKFLDNSVSSDDKRINAYFRKIKPSLIEEIKMADVVVGCVAWLTDKEILEALSEKKAVSIIVQKEDFLRPDTDTIYYLKKWKSEMRCRYDGLKGNLNRDMFRNILSRVSTNSVAPIEAVRCVGYNKSKSSICPRMHNKFLLFCKLVKEYDEQSDDEPKIVLPYAVWTGSFNLTKNANNSLENALLIKDMKIVRAFFKEYGQICAISEPLDWKSKWVEPEWRIGT